MGLCALSGMSKQNFYKGRRRREQRVIDEDLVVELVRQERRLQPELGGRKLLVRVGPELEEAGVSVGRNRFFSLLREKGLLVARRRRGPRTTDSRHRFRVYTNLLKDLDLRGPDEAWVSDLTYIRTEEGFVYLALVMDAYSRKIVGYDIDKSLEAEGCLRSLRMALGQLAEGAAPIHHSDRGTQYCCNDYVGLLEERGLAVSMTEENHCYENAKAERLNGILKQEYGLGETLRGLGEAKRMVRQAVELYNTMRPHTALGYACPESVHARGRRKEAA
jgi:transposase InsO family protein